MSRTGGRDVEAEGGTAAVQESMCRKQAELDGLTVGQVFTDLDESGGKTSRPQLDRMLSAIREGKSGGVIVRNLRRFGRTTTGVIEGIREIEEHGGAFVSVEEKIDTSSPMGRFALTIFAALGTMELEERTETWRAARQRAIGRGVQIGPAPAGYDKIEEGPDKGKLVPNEHAPTIRRAFMRRAQGASWSEVSDTLTEAGVPTWRGAERWSLSAVSKLMRNETYMGVVKSGDGYRNEKAHEAIVTRAEWKAANDRREARQRVHRDAADPEGALLTGLMKCASCGHTMVRDWTVRDGKKTPFYRCRNAGACTARASITFAKVEPWAESSSAACSPLARSRRGRSRTTSMSRSGSSSTYRPS